MTGARRVRLTANGRFAVGGAVLMFAMAVQTRSVWMQVIGCGLVGLLAISWGSVSYRRAATVVVHRRPTQPVAGVPFDIEVMVRNNGRRQTPPLRMTSSPLDNPALLTSTVIYLDPVAAGESATVRVGRVAATRGVNRRWRETLDEVGPFGFFKATETHVLGGDFFVAPADATPLLLLPVAGAHDNDTGRLVAGLDVRGIRQWRPGDEAHHVHWRSTARTGRLTVLERGEPVIGSVGLLVAGVAGDPKFERTVAVAAATARYAMDDGVLVFVAIDSAAGNRVEELRPETAHRLLAEVGAILAGPPNTVDSLFECVGRGGAVLMALGAVVAPVWRTYVESAAAAAGVDLIDVAERCA